MAIFQRDSVSLAYDDSGKGGPPLVFLHGLAGDRRTLGPQVERFGGAHRHVLVDMRGHGESSNAPFSIEGCADDTLALCKELGLEKPVVIGFSLGGIVALDMAARHGDALSGAALLDPPILLRPELLASMGDVVAGLHSPRAVETWVGFAGSMFLPLEDAEIKAAVVEQVRRTPAETITAGFDSSGPFDAPGALRACRIPLLIVSTILPSDIATVGSYCPHAWWGKVVGAGHFAHMTVPDQVNGMLARFLYSLTRAAAS